MAANLDLTGAQWRKSSYSGDTGGDCVEVAPIPTTHIAIRDSKHPTLGHLRVTPATFTTFIDATARGAFSN
ncbi:DUF397 domain-containing protein [Streptomyces justiciae]|uniref:DUF397 domain-containing protein n=1 Tax=Streptomyces justiciae TaxID=2780140 RepID=UPI00211875CB|nr:DUF397 domain-containing protein [Streptomyces justiciae]MCW8377057.1 DUF397 domain-containing protein [Streptomyces justiciae]